MPGGVCGVGVWDPRLTEAPAVGRVTRAMLAVTGSALRACEAPEGPEQDTDWTWITLKEKSLDPLPSGLILGGQAWKQRHQESHSRGWQQQQRWRERDKFNRHFCSRDGRTCWWTSVGKKRTGEPPPSPSSLGGWVRMGPRSEGDAGTWEGVQMAVTLETRKRRDLMWHSGNMPEMSRTQKSCSCFRTQAQPCLWPCYFGSPLSAQILFLDSAESVQEVSVCIVHVLAWRRRSHRAEKWKLWSFTVWAAVCVHGSRWERKVMGRVMGQKTWGREEGVEAPERGLWWRWGSQGQGSHSTWVGQMGWN